MVNLIPHTKLFKYRTLWILKSPYRFNLKKSYIITCGFKFSDTVDVLGTASKPKDDKFGPISDLEAVVDVRAFSAEQMYLVQGDRGIFSTTEHNIGTSGVAHPSVSYIGHSRLVE